jgi:hypothetical protein
MDNKKLEGVEGILQFGPKVTFEEMQRILTVSIATIQEVIDQEFLQSEYEDQLLEVCSDLESVSKILEGVRKIVTQSCNCKKEHPTTPCCEA